MGSDFDGDPSPSQRAKLLQHPSLGSRGLNFPQNLALTIQYAVATSLISEIHSDRDGFLRASVLLRRRFWSR